MSLTVYVCRIRSISAPLTGALLTVCLVSACTNRSADRGAATDSNLARDLALVQASARPQPIFRDTALTEAPDVRADVATRPRTVARPAPRSARQRPEPANRGRSRERERRQERETPPTRVAQTPPPEPQRPAAHGPAEEQSGGDAGAGSIGAGTVLAASSNARVCTPTNLPGDRITATVAAPVRGANGAEIPAGAKVVLELVSINAAEPPAIGEAVFRATSVAIGDDSYPATGGATATGSLERAQTGRSASSDRKKVIGGAIAGAILGRMMGKDTRSTVIGAAAGAAAGTAAATMGGEAEACLAEGTPIRITLDEAVMMR